jgi:isopenicillin-N N-acyltransferase-like protein
VSYSLPVIRARGGPYQRGLEHGRQCGDLIRRYPEVLLHVLRLEGSWRGLGAEGPLPGREDLLARAMTFLPSLDAFAPHIVEEVRGIADGARLSLAEVLLVNVRAEVMGRTTADALCTAFAVGRSATADRCILSGQNLDQHPLNRDLMIMLHVEPDSGPAMLMCTFAGLVGYPGINANGVSFFQNALSTRAWRAGGMPHYFFKRALLEQQDVSGCLSLARRAQFCSSANYVLTDSRGALCDLELTPDGMATLEADRDLLVHTNHFRSSSLVAEEALLPHLPDSARRAPRMEALLSSRRGRITIADLKAMLADHHDSPTGICRHQPDVETIAAIVAEPDQGRIHVAPGHPCVTGFVTYGL